jgi:hypothetical protein
MKSLVLVMSFKYDEAFYEVMHTEMTSVDFMFFQIKDVLYSETLPGTESFHSNLAQ